MIKVIFLSESAHFIAYKDNPKQPSCRDLKRKTQEFRQFIIGLKNKTGAVRCLSANL